MSLEVILRELDSRSRSKFILSEYCFKEQLDFINDPARFKTGVCSRRAGKTEACAADLLWTAVSNTEVVCLYITLSRTNAKRILWPTINKINRVFKLGGKPNESELSLTFPNNSVIYLSGAKDKTEIEKFRGLAVKKVYIDEAQAFRAYIQELIDEVLGAALFDHNGTVCMIGTPGPIPAGYFYEASKNVGWSHHTWTMHNNPHLERKSGKKVEELIAEELKRMGISVESPKVQREYFAKWVVDSNSLVFHYDATKNHYDSIPSNLTECVIGVDIGHDDADAIGAIAWNGTQPEAYLAYEKTTTKQGITELADMIKEAEAFCRSKGWRVIAVVMDTGGLGKKIAAELNKRNDLTLLPAEKSRKFEYIELLNDALLTGRLKARQDSLFAQDSFLVEYDRDKEKPDRRVVSDRYHSDICDAVLYAYRHALTWLYQPPPPPGPKVGTQEYNQAIEDKMRDEIQDRLIRQRQQADDMLADSWGGDDGWG
jgi:hypothetical protein